jgi:enamine deaminase RidA (YjgF/YER057c/UK114 family)
MSGGWTADGAGARRWEDAMVVLQHVIAPEGVAAGRGYSQVVAGRGRLVVVSGQVAQDEHGELIGPGDPEAQARQVFENLRRCLAEGAPASATW